MQLKTHIDVAVVPEVFAQIWTAVKFKERAKPETTLVQITKILKKYWTLSVEPKFSKYRW